MLDFQCHDGGRAAAGYKSTRDCVCRAVSLATGQQYFATRCELAHVQESTDGRYSGGNGIHTQHPPFASYIASKGFVPRLAFHHDINLLPSQGIFLVRVHRHMVCVRHGILYDTWDGRTKYPLYGHVLQVWEKMV